MKIKKTDEELVALIQGGIDVQENMDALFRHFRGYMYWMANKYPCSSTKETEGILTADDLVQEGYIGLMEALKTYKKVEGVEFLTYANYYVRKAMWVYSQTMRYTVTTSEYLFEQLSKHEKFCAAYFIENNAEPSDTEIMNAMGFTHQQYQSFKKSVQSLESVSLYTPVPGTDDGTFADFISDDTDVAEAVIDDIQADLCEKVLWDCVNELPKKRAQVIVEKYKNNKTSAEIAEMRGVTKAIVHRLERKALDLLWEKEEIQALQDDFDYRTEALHSTGFKAWKENMESSVERAVQRKLQLEDGHNANLAIIEKKLKQLNQEKQELLESMFQHPIDEIIPCILVLPDRALEVFIMRTVEGMRNIEVAKALNTASSNANKSYALAKSKIQEALAV